MISMRSVCNKNECDKHTTKTSQNSAVRVSSSTEATIERGPTPRRSFSGRRREGWGHNRQPYSEWTDKSQSSGYVT
ncbi:hypothetical protein B0T13DRAFT_170935 [Neurospora crassa]|nr:hypothetical protein B0T13DRAFT_170935 [Neurospora crassa]